jgi:acyl-coenzyme A synthetase/AMP-(fatty) acid ligase
VVTSSLVGKHERKQRMWQQLFGNRGFYLGVMFHRAARRHGPVPVVLDRPLDVAPDAGTHHTYASIAELVDELAARLGAAGVRRGDHVAIHKEDNFDIAVLACAAARLGAVPALLSPTLSAAVVLELLDQMQRPWLLTDKVKLDGLDGAQRVLVVPLAEFAGAPRRPPVKIGHREPAMITHSSGTTGLPKLALHFPYAMWNRLVPQKMLGWPTRGQSAALCMSYVHSRFYHALGVFLHYGSPLLILVDHDPASVAPRLVQARPAIVETHPNTFVLWEDLADAPGAPLSSVRCYGSTFDAIHPRTVQRLLAAGVTRVTPTETRPSE